jgi:hypothetical protein
MSEQNMVERLRKAVPLFEHGKSVGQTRIYENQRREAAERIEQLERERDEQAVLLENATENAAKYLNDWQAALQRAEQSDLALAEARREGYVMVPREPTEEMIAAFYEEWSSFHSERHSYRDYWLAAYKAMLDAAISGNQPHTGD